MERLENELALTYLNRCQSALMMKCVAERKYKSWLETFLTYMEIYSFDVEVIIEAEFNDLKHFRT